MNNKFDPVDQPRHYANSSIQCIDAMAAMVESVEFDLPIDFHDAHCWQTAFKYLWRWHNKNGVEDLRKCRYYLDRLISRIEAREPG